MIEPINLQISEQTGVNLVLLVCFTQIWVWTHSMYAHPTHEPLNALAVNRAR
ncbi:uncharacterized protein METZ01_LOCUS342228 [marine metagenome]|uniref:Uncharacterized protein n=1 Tax=marine metagenome TaxID=408172 RepID=A0A382QV54_9ZZZZ